MEYEILGAEEVKELKIYWKIHLYEYLNHQEYNGYSVKEKVTVSQKLGEVTLESVNGCQEESGR